MSNLKLVRPELRGLKSYNAAVQVNDTIRLNANEMPGTGDTDHFRRPLNRYPEVRPVWIRNALAERFDCAADNVLVTRGSSEAIDLLFRVFCRAGVDNAVTTKPTFSMYSHYALVQGAALREVMTIPADDFVVSSDSLVRACNDKTRLIFLCSPNNPTGTALKRQTLEEILTARAGKSVVVVDEAYVEFSEQGSCVDMLGTFDNLVVLRTLSKAAGLAGARCGVAIGCPDTIQLLGAVQAPYALATPVVEYIENVLRGRWLDSLQEQIDEIIGERARVTTELEALHYIDTVFPSQSNFVLVRTSRTDEILRQTERDRILVRVFSDTLLGYVRITIGSRQENEKLMKSLRSLAGS